MAEVIDYMANGWRRHDAFHDILKRYPPREVYEDGDIVILIVRFNAGENRYCYRTKDDVYKPGDLVIVDAMGERKAVEVVQVGYYSPEDYPFNDVKIKTVLGPADGDLAAKYREAIDEELSREMELDEIRELAKKELEEARRMKTASTEESREAKKLRDEAKAEKSEAERLKEEALSESSDAKRLKEEADSEKAQAESILNEAKKMAEDAKRLAEETLIAGKRARIENERLENAKIEASKVWKRPRKKTSDPTVLGIRRVQDALDIDEEIYKGLSSLEEKIKKVMDRAAELKEGNKTSTMGQEIERLYDFYFPKTVDVLDQYRNIFVSGLPPAAVERLRAEVLETIKTSEDVYDNVLADLYNSDIIELTSELKALRSMFAVNGLTES